MSCKGICGQLSVKLPRVRGLLRYKIHGIKRCHTCECDLKSKGNRCPCCGRLFRTKARYGKYRATYYLRDIRGELINEAR